jgi:serine/threonine protein kinase/tetratricopeptide (TPR) repeat protein
VEQLRDDMVRRWQAGEPMPVEAYLCRQSELRSDPEGLLCLVYQEILLREARGEAPRLQECLERFPNLGPWLPKLFEVHGALEGSQFGRRVGVDGNSWLEAEARLRPGAAPPGSAARVPLPRAPAARDPETTRSGEDRSFPGPRAPLRGWLPPPGYEIVGELGRGGMGVVWRARDRKRGRDVALKTIQHCDAGMLYRFKQEFRALADVAHPNLVSLYELATAGETWFFTMELVDGVDFCAYVRAEGGGPAALDVGRLRAALRQLAEGVCALHAAGQLHRDIKPSNVLVTRTGRVVLLDFGLAGALDAEGLYHSAEQQVAGTAAYMAPEQAACQPVSPASDWYSVGVLLYEALTGRLPFEGLPLQVLQAKQQTDPPPPRALAPAVPEDLDGLCQELLRRQPHERPRGPEVLGRLGTAPTARVPAPRPEVPLIGRDPHLHALDRAFAAVQRGRVVTALVSGPSGFGKSALVQHFLGRLCERDAAVVLAGRCYERESVPYKALDPVVDALSRYLRHLSVLEVRALLPRHVTALARVFPVLRQVEAVAAPRRALDVPDPQELRRRAFTALRELLGRLGDRRPLVVAIDDLQWGDADSAALLAELLRPPDPPTLLLLGCYRSEDVDTSPCLRVLLPALRQAEPSGEHLELAVEPLSPSEARGLALTLLGRVDEATTAQAEAIAREAAGNPFFVRELVQYVAGGAELPGPGAAPEITLEQVLQARIAALPPAARSLLELVAVAGQPLRQGDAGRALDLPAEERDALALLRAARLLRATGPGEQDAIDTYHDRVREILVAHLAPAMLQGRHRRLAQVLEASGDVDLEVLAVHFAAAGEPEKAGTCYARAGARAAEALAFDRAARLYRRALELRPGDATAESPLRAELGNALANAGRGAEAAREYLAAATGAGAADALELRKRAAQQLLFCGDLDDGFRMLREVLAAVGLPPASTPGRALLGLLVRRLRVRLRGLRFRERAVGEVPAEALRRIDVAWAGAVGLEDIDPVASVDLQGRHLLLALRAGEPYRVARALALEAVIAAYGGRAGRRRSAALLEAAAALAERIAHPHARGLVLLATGIVANLQGRWKAARAAYEQAEPIFRDHCRDVAWERYTAQAQCCIVLVPLGETAELLRRLPGLFQEAQERGSLPAWTNGVGFLRPLTCLIEDDPARARQELERHRARLPRQGYVLQHFQSLLAEADVALYSGEGAQAWASFRQSWSELARSPFLRLQIVRVLGRERRARCALAAAVGSAAPEPLLREAEYDARRLERERVSWAVAHALLLRAGLAACRGDRDGAIRLLAAATQGFESVDMALYAAGARRRHGELLGGAAGRDLVAAADAWMAGQLVRNPRRMTGLLAPGFPPTPIAD